MAGTIPSAGWLLSFWLVMQLYNGASAQTSTKPERESNSTDSKTFGPTRLQGGVTEQDAMQLSVTSFAQNQADLQSETPLPDNQPQSPTVLHGEINRQGQIDNVNPSTPSTKTGTVHFSGLPFSRKNKLSSDDYRKLEFGVTGFISQKMFFGKYPVVTEVFPGCPAEQAGIHPGDVMLRANDYEFRRADMQRDFWKIMDGRAGSTVALTVRRHGHIMTFNLTRMNIEDIPDAHLRRTFERMLRAYGPPSFDGN